MHLPWIKFAASLLVVAVAIPLALRKVPKNMWYGVRTTRTVNGSSEDWYEANGIAGTALIFTGFLSAALDIALGFAPLQREMRYLIAMVALLGAVLAPLVIYRKRLF